MKLECQALTLRCKGSVENIPFQPGVSFFHGRMASGKSSIVRLIDFCLGSDIEPTPALSQELVTATLAVKIGEYEAIFERDLGVQSVRVTWRAEDGRAATVQAPIKPQATPIWEEDIFSLSDLIFHLLGVEPIRVLRKKSQEDSPLVRMSIRNIMWFCYLRQERIDSDFFRLEEPIEMARSRDVMEYIVGSYSEEATRLKAKLASRNETKRQKEKLASQMKDFLQRCGVESGEALSLQSEEGERQLAGVRDSLAAVREQSAKNAHPVDSLRTQLRELSRELSIEKEALEDLDERVKGEEELRAELITAKFKLARAASAANVLAGVTYEVCPCCGVKVSTLSREADECPLCGNRSQATESPVAASDEVVRGDLESRLSELTASIEAHARSRIRQVRIVQRLTEKKAVLDQRLTEETSAYDSVFLAQSRELEQQVARLEERMANLRELKRLPEEVRRAEAEVDGLAAEIEGIRRQVKEAERKGTSEDLIVEELEAYYLEALLASKVPGISSTDKVRIDRKSWIPEVLPDGKEVGKLTFANAGSGGKKTLLNACFLLALHRVAAIHDLPLPTLVMIDSPMKNIGKDVNQDVFKAFYKHLYGLASSDLRGSQFILVDVDLFEPDVPGIPFSQRLMTPDDPKHLPLVGYYRGH